MSFSSTVFPRFNARRHHSSALKKGDIHYDMISGLSLLLGNVELESEVFPVGKKGILSGK
jgi:hypothetical protein